MSAAKNRRSGWEDFLGGLGVFAICSVLFGLHILGPWIVVIGVFLGAFPMIRGLKKIGRERQAVAQGRTESLEDHNQAAQRAILRQASKNGGVVTPASVAMASDLPIDVIDQTLQNLAARGYAEMNIRSNGTIEYLISEFIV